MSDSAAANPEPSTIIVLSATVLSDVDPHGVRSDALAQVIEHELERRLPGASLTLEFRTTSTLVDPRRRTRWKSAANSPTPRRSAAIIIDIRLAPPSPSETAVGHVPLPDISGWFAEQISPAALETRRLMLDHLGITEPTGLSATDHVALGRFDPVGLSADKQHAASAALDQIAGLVQGNQSSASIVELMEQVTRLRSERDTIHAQHAAREHAAQLELARRDHELRSLRLRIANDDPDLS